MPPPRPGRLFPNERRVTSQRLKLRSGFREVSRSVFCSAQSTWRSYIGGTTSGADLTDVKSLPHSNAGRLQGYSPQNHSSQ
jgi:hypothetical protein